MLRKQLLDVICCPICKGDLQYKQKEELLICKSCGKKYPVKDDVPMLLPDDADAR